VDLVVVPDLCLVQEDKDIELLCLQQVKEEAEVEKLTLTTTVVLEEALEQLVQLVHLVRMEKVLLV